MSAMNKLAYKPEFEQDIGVFEDEILPKVVVK